MITFGIVLVVLTILVAAYVGGGRAWLKTKPWSAGLFARVEWIETKGWRKSETLLKARFLQVLGVVLTGLSAAGQFDLSPIFPYLPPWLHWLPPMLPLIVSMSGALEENLRRNTTKPLELVEVADVPTPHVAAALAVAEAETKMAVRMVAADTEAAEREVSGAT